MRIIRALSIIGLAAYLVLQGLYFFSEQTSPLLHSLIGVVGLATGVLMFITLTHWFDPSRDKKP
jgi:hypothetical protein